MDYTLTTATWILLLVPMPLLIVLSILQWIIKRGE
ncbi:hypothetical protein AJ85_09610 [Alkalihalobacillus alcalophilus ATCC 27647 = CGMCC 1.3604]|uniref:Uncharacterized protein n=1 Tax=Alkalihalobacillus alcalophilus ATCC 27647 = CGMCC 1.3604 TaxID=1218173 RepID=A0A4S4K196_ALKAL|nr:hypothetical protein AJ85_09610 [Alkalihalobacillus alcalophilus ATCC 27647 = CGMCC 1.3604]